MPSVDAKKKGQASSSVFAAALPRSVVVEGTFQVRMEYGVYRDKVIVTDSTSALPPKTAISVTAR